MSQPGAKAKKKWASLLKEFETSEESVASFCARHDVSTASFYLWRRRLADEMEEAFVPVEVEERTVDSGRMVRLYFPSQVSVEIPVDQGELIRQAIYALAELVEPKS